VAELQVGMPRQIASPRSRTWRSAPQSGIAANKRNIAWPRQADQGAGCGPGGPPYKIVAGCEDSALL